MKQQCDIVDGAVSLISWLVLHFLYNLQANALLAFACTLSFPIQFYPAIEVLEKSLSRPGSLMRPAALPHTALNRHRPHHHHHQQQQHIGDEHSRHGHLPGLHLALDFYGHHADSTADAPRLHGASVGHHPHSLQTRPPTRVPRFLERVFKMSQYECNRTVFRSMICTSLMLIAVCIPDVGLLISLFGAVGSSMLAIIIPPVMYLKLHKHSLSLPSRLFHYSIIIFGIVGMVAGTLEALVEVAKSIF